jgi:hypothetical protein
MDKPESCFYPLAAAGGLSIGLSGNAALDILTLHRFAHLASVNGLRGGADEAFVTGAAGLILFNPNHQKLFSTAKGEKLCLLPE